MLLILMLADYSTESSQITPSFPVNFLPVVGVNSIMHTNTNWYYEIWLLALSWDASFNEFQMHLDTQWNDGLSEFNCVFLFGNSKSYT